MKDLNDSAVEAIDRLGGTAKMSRMFGISMPSVTKWKRVGIPKARMMFLKLAHAQALEGIDLEAATAKEQEQQEAGRDINGQEGLPEVCESSHEEAA